MTTTVQRSRGAGRRWVLAALVLLTAACTAPPNQTPGPRADDDRLARLAMDRGDYTAAADLYRRALERVPENASLHYGLAVAASHLDLRAEAVREFEWVVQRGEAGAGDVEAARSWLVKAGALQSTRQVPPDDEGARASLASATIEGRVVSNPGADSAPMKRQLLFLVEQPGRGRHYRLRTDEDGQFRFADVAPGIYELSDRVSGSPMWRLRVDVQPGQIVFLDLGADNSTKVRDDFPDRH